MTFPTGPIGVKWPKGGHDGGGQAGHDATGALALLLSMLEPSSVDVGFDVDAVDARPQLLVGDAAIVEEFFSQLAPFPRRPLWRPLRQRTDLAARCAPRREGRGRG